MIQQLLIEAFAKLLEKMPNSKLLIAGDGPLKSSLESKIANLNIKNNVQLLGSRNDIAELLSASDVFVLTSKSEGLSLSMIEAALSGLPVITTESGGPKDIIKNGFSGYFVAFEVDDIARRMKQLAEDPLLRKRLGRVGKNLAKNRFSLAKMIDKHQALYNSLIEKRKLSFRPVPLFKIYSDKDDIRNVTKILESRMFWAIGKENDDFEEKISQYIGCDYALTFNSGTSAIYASLLAAGIGAGDEVIVPAFTYIATVEPVSLVGAKPVFADVEEKTLGLDPEDVAKKISKKTKAIIAVHYAGVPCQIVTLKKIAEKNRILLIEDAAEAFGSAIGNKKIGTFGDLAIFSFSQGKIITTGEGGAAVTNSKEFYDKLKLIRSLGRKEATDTTHVKMPLDFIQAGFNLRLANILATLGISQLSKIDQIMTKRRELADYYRQKLGEIKEVKTISCSKKIVCGYQMFPILADNRDGLQDYLAQFNIASKVYFEPVYQHFLYRNQSAKLQVTEGISSRILSIPFYAAMRKQDVDYIVSIIKIFYQKTC